MAARQARVAQAAEGEQKPSSPTPAPRKPAASTATPAKNSPRARPGRATATKPAAGKDGSGRAATDGSGRSAARKPKAGSPATGARTSSRTRRRASAAAADPVPRQGFASEEESLTGAVQPPGGAELVASATEILGELAKSGLSTGERLVKDLLSRLSHS